MMIFHSFLYVYQAGYVPKKNIPGLSPYFPTINPPSYPRGKLLKIIPQRVPGTIPVRYIIRDDGSRVDLRRPLVAHVSQRP